MKMFTGSIMFNQVCLPLFIAFIVGFLLNNVRGELASSSSVRSDLQLRGGKKVQSVKRTKSSLKDAPRVPVFLMMPLDTVNSTSGKLSENAAELLPGAKEVSADGIMVDVWWGLCEQEAGTYNFSGYVDLLQRCKDLGLQVQAVMSFHACGGHIGDSVNVPLPQWVLDLEEEVPELFYRDQVREVVEVSGMPGWLSLRGLCREATPAGSTSL